VRGVLPNALVEVRAVTWHGTRAITLTYRGTDGNTGERIIYRDDEATLEIEAPGRAWSFDADGNLFRLVSEARRIQYAYLFDPLLAVHLSAVEPLPHQIEAVYGEMLPRHPLRFLLADDPGAGKTIMAGLLIKELALRGDLHRCLVVAPGGLVAQWQDELADKFGLRFELLTNDMIESSRTGNPFEERNLLIARLDHLARNEELQARLGTSDWDLIVVDEAHRMAAHWFGNEIKETKRYVLGKHLGALTRHLLLMTATPHSGKEEDFQLFMSLLDADRFEGRFRDGVHAADVSDLMRRMVKEDLLRFDGRRLFPERKASTVPYKLTDAEASLYEAVTRYVVEEMNKADDLKAEGEGRRGNRIGFALTVLQRRLASSPEAIYQSLRRRRGRIEDRIAEEQLRQRARQADGRTPAQRLLDEVDERDDDPDAYDDLADDELEEIEEEIVDEATAARTVEELRAELRTLEHLESLALKVKRSGEDRKWNELASLMHDEPALRGPDGARRKLIVFTEHRDTLNYLVERLRTLIGQPEAVVAIHGGTKREDRRRIQEVFTQNKDCLVLVATDAAGEGVNLQRAHLLVNYDLPWNPNRIEQRFGRVHRIGQTEVCHMWNLVAEETREGQVYRRLLDKLETMRERLGGRVFDVLGEAFRDTPLRDLLLRAVRYGDDPATRLELDQVIDARVGEGLVDLVSREALASDVMRAADVERIRAELEEAEARRLQPHYVRSFFLAAFRQLGGRSKEREPGRYELTHVPQDIRSRDRVIGIGAPVLSAYERVCFERNEEQVAGLPVAEFICPGHPLLESARDLLVERHGSLLQQGAVLVDEADESEAPRLLVYLDHAIADGRRLPHGSPHIVSRRFEFVTITEDGEPVPAGVAPYLDYRPATADDLVLVAPMIEAPWLRADVETRALDAAIEHAVPAHLAQVRSRTLGRIERVRAAVHDRLTREINYLDGRAAQLRLDAETGKGDVANTAKFAKRADELAGRMRARMAELDAEEQLTALPPVVVGGALVVPRGLLERAGGERAQDPETFALNRAAVERRAVDAVLAEEHRLGREPEEMPYANPGFDIRSTTADGHLLFVEVKGRIEGATSVTVTRNEILFGLNAPERHVLALVRVGEDRTDEVRYLRGAFEGMEGRVHFAETSVNFDWHKLWSKAEVPS